MSVRILPRVVAAPPGRPERARAADSQAHSQAIAVDPSRWSHDDIQEVVATYAQLAPIWASERGSYRPAPVRDALDRGGPWPAGACLEIGAGTGLLTPLLSAVWPVVSLDVSRDMLRRSPAAWRVLADGARLSIASRSIAAVVLGDAPLFAPEVVRVLRADGVILWSNALGDAAPHYVPTSMLVDALSAQGESWDAVMSEAGWGSWVVLRRPSS